MAKYYTVRILAAFLFMASFGCGFLAGAEYGRWIGWMTFLIMATLGVILHKVADRHYKKI